MHKRKERQEEGKKQECQIEERKGQIEQMEGKKDKNK